MGRLVGLAAHRLRRQVGSVGLNQEQLLGQRRRRLAQLLDVGKVTIPEKEQYQPRSIASSTRQGARKQWRITGTSSASSSRIPKTSSMAPVSPSGSRAWITIGSPRSLGDLDLGDKRPALLLGARGLPVVIDPGLADRPHLLVLGQAGDLGLQLSSNSPAAVG